MHICPHCGSTKTRFNDNLNSSGFYPKKDNEKPRQLWECLNCHNWFTVTSNLVNKKEEKNA